MTRTTFKFTAQKIILIAIFTLTSLIGFSQLHAPVACSGPSSSASIQWSTTPAGSSQFNWTPAGALANNLTNISGTGVDAAISFSGQTGTFGVWGTQTPSVGNNPTGGGAQCLQLYTTGFTVGISMTLDFSVPIGEIAFDLANVNALPGANGDFFTITALNELGQVVYPTFTASATPSYTFDAFGNINATAPSTAGNNDEIGINLSDPNRLVSFTIFWGNCSTCTNVIHGLGIQNIDFCIANNDGDLLGDHIDIDDDNDGIPDLDETNGLDPLSDLDGDGVWAYLDDDDNDPSVFNNNGNVEAAFDFDGDNIPNHFDLDGDNDAIADIIEAGGTDLDGDGEADYPTSGDPQTMVDVNNNGLSDPYDSGATVSNMFLTEPGDCSGTTVNYNHNITFLSGTIDATTNATLTFCISGDYGNALTELMTLSGESGVIGTFSKLNSSNIGYADCGVAPMCITTTITAAQWNLWNNDGVVNFTVTPSAAVNFCTNYSCLSNMTVAYSIPSAAGVTIPLYNSDLTGNPDFLDLDSDNDGIGDIIELNLGSTVDDLGGGTTLDGMVGNGAIVDVNRNGWSDADEGVDARIDSDGDGLLDMLEVDADNDGIRDFFEGPCTFCPSFGVTASLDSDGDGFSDQFENLTAGNLSGGTNQGLNPNDHESDGTPDYLDLDSDNDGGFDWTEGYDVNGDGISAPEFEATAVAYAAAGGNPLDYPIVNSDTDIVPNFADNQPFTFSYVEATRPPFFDATTASWVDNDQDGLVDLMDDDISGFGYGQSAPLPNTDGINDRDWRDVNTIVILPIELIEFSATPFEREVQLAWKTASEFENDYFILQRSDDAQTWTDLAEVDAVGNSTSVSSYNWTDEQPLDGISYYRLRVVDVNMNVEYSHIEVVNRSQPDEILLYPNPAVGKVTLKANFEFDSQVELVAVTGAIVFSEQAPKNNSITFDVSSLESGCYFFSFVQKNGERTTRKFVVSPK